MYFCLVLFGDVDGAAKEPWVKIWFHSFIRVLQYLGGTLVWNQRAAILWYIVYGTNIH